MINAVKFKKVFGVYATEIWAMPESDFLRWLNGEYNGEERKTGKWIDVADEYDKRAGRHDYVCSECKTFARSFVSGYEDWWCGTAPKYCPNCGLEMEVDE